MTVNLRFAHKQDLEALLALESSCFQSDRINRRSFKHFLRSLEQIFIVAEVNDVVVGYALVLCHQGTRLARLYSIAVSPTVRGLGIGKQLLERSERQAAQKGRLFMRLEVSATNQAAIQLYTQLGYRAFGEYDDYYEDHSDALRMQKTIRRISEEVLQRPTAWYGQSTDFTCGPASLLMAMSSLHQNIEVSLNHELALWREATTIFMTSGHGGTHPIGLAIAARKRGFKVEVFINSQEPLFLQGVRSNEKKHILSVVHAQFVSEALQLGISLHYRDIDQEQVQEWLHRGWAVLVLISTFRLDGRKAPHWVVVTHVDDQCFYLHDPDVDSDRQQQPIDCQYLPIAKDDFAKMSSFGADRLRCAVAIRLDDNNSDNALLHPEG